jgi:restriction system protein
VSNWWMIKNDDDIIVEWFKNNVVSIGFSKIGNPKLYATKDELLVKCDEIYSNQAPIFRIQIESQLWRFSREIKIDDKIITYNKKDRKYYMATVKNNPVFLPEASKDYPNIIKVSWSNKSVLEDNISEEIKNSLNSPVIIYQIANYEKELENIFNSTVQNNAQDYKTKELIDFENEAILNCENIIKKLKDFQVLKIVDEIFRLNGYIFTGMNENDLAYDIDAVYIDQLRFLNCKVKIYIAKGENQFSIENVKNKLNNSEDNIRLISISINGFKEEVKSYKSNMLIDGRSLVKLIFSQYDNFSDDLKGILNLKKIYI